MTIRVTNATFESTSADEFETVDDAFQAAVRAGVAIATDEILGGMTSTIVQIAVDTNERADTAIGAVALASARFWQAGPEAP